MKFVGFEKKEFFLEQEACPDDSGFLNPAHYHDRFEIYFITEGSCDYFINDRSYHLQPGDLALIPEGVIHNTAYHNTGHTRLLINCRSRYIPASVRPQYYLYRNPAVKDQIEALLNQIKEEYESPDSFSEEAVFCHMRLLFFLLARHPNCYAEQGSSAVTKVSAYLRKNFAEELSLSDAAAFAAVSPAHLSRLFKKELGMGFSEYLNLLRLQKAEQLLQESEGKRIAEIAAECGFFDSNYFSVKFKKLYGCSPAVYKKTKRQRKGTV